ncbi:MAG: WD40/YVTN/BNR-like repeat-containing protein, partial [Solirubrobacteraceae bacterium]
TATYGRNLTSQIAGTAAAGGNREALQGMARILSRFLEDQSHAYSILAQGLLSEKIRCGAASVGDNALVARITEEVNPDRAFKLGGTDGTVADRFDLHTRADLFAVAARDERIAAAGYFGTVLLSQDGGATWDTPQTGTDEPMYVVALGPGDEVWAAGRAGVVLRSEDGGRTWTRRPTPFNRHVFGLYTAGAGEVLAVGDYGLQLRTQDGGAHWSCIPREQDVILGRITKTGSDATVAGEFGTLERLPAGVPPGKRGTLAGVPEDLYVFDVWMDEAGTTGVAVGLGGAILRSDDGGATWSRVQTEFKQDLFGVGGSGARVVISGESGLLLVSEDAGRTFRLAESPVLPVTLTDAEFADAQHVYAVGPRGLVL